MSHNIFVLSVYEESTGPETETLKDADTAATALEALAADCYPGRLRPS